MMHLLLGTGTPCRCADCVPGGKGTKLPGTEKLAHPYGPVSGLYVVRGQDVRHNGTARLKHELTTNVLHKLDIRVRLLGERASVQFDLDGASLITWEGPLKDLKPANFSVKNSKYPDVYFPLIQQPGRTLTYSKITLTAINRNSWLSVPVMK
jgi:hypothetical protein